MQKDFIRTCLPTRRRLTNTFPSVHQWRKEHCRGLTLVELLIAVGIIAILAAITVPAYTYFIDKAKNIRAIAEIHGLEKEIRNYELDNGALPDTLNDLGKGILLDPWKRPYEYSNPPKRRKPKEGKKEKGDLLNEDYDLYSRGKDGKSKQIITDKDSKDDIIRADEGEYIGLASKY